MAKNRNKNITANASEINTTPRIFTVQEAYILDESRYRILKSEESSWKDWKTKFLFAFIGSTFTLIAKVVEKLAKQEKLNLENWYLKWEVWVCIISLVAFLLTLLISCCKKSDKKTLIKEIDEHFEKNTRLIKVENQS